MDLLLGVSSLEVPSAHVTQSLYIYSGLERPNSVRIDWADTLICPHITPQMGIHGAYYPCAKLTTHHDPAEWFGILPVTQPLRHRTGELSAK